MRWLWYKFGDTDAGGIWGDFVWRRCWTFDTCCILDWPWLSCGICIGGRPGLPLVGAHPGGIWPGANRIPGRPVILKSIGNFAVFCRPIITKKIGIWGPRRTKAVARNGSHLKTGALRLLSFKYYCSAVVTISAKAGVDDPNFMWSVI